MISDIDTEDYVAKRFTKKRGKNKCRGKILEAHANVKAGLPDGTDDLVIELFPDCQMDLI